MLFCFPMRFFMIFLLLLPCCWPYTFQLYETTIQDLNYYCVGSFIDYQVGSPFCTMMPHSQDDNQTPSQNMPFNRSVNNDSVQVFPAFDEYTDTDWPKVECKTEMTQSPSSSISPTRSEFDTVVCYGIKKYPVLWASIFGAFTFQRQQYIALVLNTIDPKIKIDNTIVSEFFVGYTGKLNARVVASKSNNYYLDNTERKSETLPKRDNVEVKYVKLATGTVVQPVEKKDFQFNNFGVIPADEGNYEEKNSLKKSVIVNVARFNGNVQVIAVRLNFENDKYVLTVYFDESFEEIPNPQTDQPLLVII